MSIVEGFWTSRIADKSAMRRTLSTGRVRLCLLGERFVVLFARAERQDRRHIWQFDRGLCPGLSAETAVMAN